MTNPVYRGSCLCGSVKYEVSGDLERFTHCHCARCRKATGTGHATNLVVKTNKIHWLQGESMLAFYKVPEAERFTNCFCKNCGARVPRYIPELGFVLIPAGSLDHEPGIAPQSRIFWNSRASWSCSGDNLPVFAEYPE
jgi:hypothetical protein